MRPRQPVVPLWSWDDPVITQVSHQNQIKLHTLSVGDAHNGFSHSFRDEQPMKAAQHWEHSSQ